MQPEITDPYFTNQLMAVDGKWDIGPGIWFEYTYKKNDEENILFEKSEHYLNIGMDYTFGMGNGLNISTEYFRYEGKISNNYSVMAMNYPLGLMNRVVMAVYYNWDTSDWYRFLSLQHNTDYWTFNLMTYWNPEDAAIYGSADSRNIMAGKGLQFMAVLNF